MGKLFWQLSTCSKNASLIDIRGNAFLKYLVSENSYFYAEASSIFIFKGAAQKCQLLKLWQRNDEIFINLCRASIRVSIGMMYKIYYVHKISALNGNKNISIIFCRIVCRMACWKNSRDRVERMAMEEENKIIWQRNDEVLSIYVWCRVGWYAVQRRSFKLRSLPHHLLSTYCYREMSILETRCWLDLIFLRLLETMNLWGQLQQSSKRFPRKRGGAPMV